MPINLDRLNKMRVETARKVLRDKDLDAILVTAYDNVRYVTGTRLLFVFDWYADGYAAVLAAEGEPLLLGPFAQGVVGLTHGWKSYPFGPNALLADRWVDIFSEILTKFRAQDGKIGLDYMPFITYERLKEKLPKATFVPILRDLLEARAIKNDEEIKILRQAAGVAVRGIEAGEKFLKPGVRENELYARMISEMLTSESEGETFYPMCSSGKRSVSTVFPGNAQIKEGEPIVMDIGCVIQGYSGDCMRTAIMGRASKEVKDLYAAIHDAYMNGAKTIKPGAKGSDVDSAIRQSLAAQGYPDYPHSTGHGIGIKLCELPLIHRKEELGALDLILRPGMVFAIEPRTYREGISSVGLEDMWLVTESGSEALTKTSYLENLF